VRRGFVEANHSQFVEDARFVADTNAVAISRARRAKATATGR
jgi:hypothetical protein